MRIVYIADDGREFDNPYECEEYEELMKHNHLNEIAFFDDRGQRYHFKTYPSVFDDQIYGRAVEVMIPDEDALNDFLWVTEQCGWCEFEQITSPGDWFRTSGEYPIDEGTWHKWEGKAE